MVEEINKKSLRSKWQKYWPVGIFILGFWVSLILMLVINENGDVVLFYAEHRMHFLNLLAIYGTRLGEEAVYYFAAIILVFRNVLYSLMVAVTGLSVLGIVYLLKIWFAHPRPHVLYEVPSSGLLNAEGWYILTGYNSFPSGHTTGAFAIATILSFVSHSRWWSILFFVLAVMVGWSRVYLAQHFVKDVFFGSFCGIIIASIVIYIFNRYLPHWGRPITTFFPSA